MNKHTTPETSMLLRNKLAKLAIRLQKDAHPTGVNPDLNTMEQIVGESIKILSKFYKDLSEPSFTPADTIANTVPDPVDFNSNFEEIRDDLNVVFSEFENLEGVVLGNFNYMSSRLNRLNRKMKSVSSKLADFILFSDLSTKDAIFFGDSFNNMNRIQFNTPLLNSTQAEINQVEGIITLPANRSVQVAITPTEVPVINSNSNGVRGNNQEFGADHNGDMSTILDNNADTWFEYERVLPAKKDDGIPLVLNFTINLGDEKIVNFVRVNPNNFGAKTQIEILAIDTSVDGKNFVSIKDDIPIAGFTAEDEKNEFTLAPSTSKYAGQGLYTFTPRKAKYLHLTLRQESVYPIVAEGDVSKLRYAIGIKDVEIQSIPYLNKGEMISAEYQVKDEIKKVVLQSNQKPDSNTVSKLASISHFVSPDNGVTWHQIRPKESVGLANVIQEIPELLDFNGVSEKAIETANPVFSLRYKATLERFTDAFTGDSDELAQDISSKTELHTPPSTTPFNITLEETPVDGTTKIIDPSFGSRGKDEVQYNIAVGNAAGQKYHLPFKPFKRNLAKVESGGYWYLDEEDAQNIYIGGQLWTRNLTSDSASTDLHYAINFNEATLEFGDGTTGKAPPSSSIVSMTLNEERLSPGIGVDHISPLEYPCSNDQKNMTIQVVHPIEIKTEVLDKGAVRHSLEEDIIDDSTDYPISFSDTSTFQSGVNFVDGSSEFQDIGHNEYSLDFTNGVLYSENRTRVTYDSTVTYFYRPRTTLTENDWSFISDGGVANSISISNNAFQTFEIKDSETVPTGVKYFNLANLAPVKGTVVFSGNITDVLDLKRDFIDGRTELLGAVYAKEQLDPIIVGGEAISIPFKLTVINDNSFSVDLTSQLVFTDEKTVAIDVVATGDYFIDRLNSQIIYWADPAAVPIADPGYVSYYYVNPQINLTGAYSINYTTGEVFLNDTTVAGITVMYEYTDIRAKYNIAREVEEDDWTLDQGNNKITINDREIIKSMNTPLTTGGKVNRYYQVSYDYVASTRPDISELEPFFSPVLKDYSLKIITKSRLV